MPEERVDEVVRELAERLSAVVIGNPAERETQLGPVMSADQLEDVRDGIRALEQTGELACGGAEPVGEVGYFVTPTLVVARDTRANVIHNREVFGPVATVLPYSGQAADAIELANLGGGGLVASIYSDDREWATEVTRPVIVPSPITRWHSSGIGAPRSAIVKPTSFRVSPRSICMPMARPPT